MLRLASLTWLALTGCSFFRLSHEQELLAALLTGRVQLDPGRPGDIQVAHFALSPEGVSRRETERLAAGTSQYGFFVDPKETHFLVAFQDLNGDWRWEPGEPAGVLPLTDGVQVSPREVRALPTIVLSESFQPLQRFDLDLRDHPDNVRSQLAIGEIARLDAPAFAPERATAGMWQPLEMARASGLGIYFLEPYDPSKIPVLFVHGLRGSPATSRQ